MKTFVFIIFILLMGYLISSFLRSLLTKKRLDQGVEKPSINSWIIPAIIAALVANGLISESQSEELEGMSFHELEDFLLSQGIFESQGEMKDWLLHQPELVGTGDSVFGGIDDFEQ